MTKLKNLGDKRLKENMMITLDLARYVGELSLEIKRQIGILIDRAGYVQYVIVGDTKSIEIPQLDRTRLSGTRLRGLRLIHTHLKEEPLNEEDLADLVLLRSDYFGSFRFP
jgi:GTPase